MKVNFHYEGVEPSDVIAKNIAHSHSLGLPPPKGTGRKRLACIGGGPSVVEYLDEIRAFDGDLWIVGSAFQWARKNGIDGVYFNIDPLPDSAQDCAGAARAIVASCVHPDSFVVLRGADVSVFDLVETPERMNHGVTTVTAVPELALMLDYEEVVFYGCESSFEEKTHAYKNDLETNPRWMRVTSNGGSFKTRPDFFAQAEFLATMIRRFPRHFKERSGGFLAAMVATMDYDMTQVSRALYDTFNFNNGG